MSERRSIRVMVRRCVCVLVIAAAAAAVLVAQPPAVTLIVRGGTLIDGTGAPPRPNGAILVAGGRFRELTADTGAASPGSATVIDATGKFILPGLIDSHSHYNGWDATLYPYWGVTTIFDLGNLTEWVVAQKAAIAAGHIPGARLFSTGNHLNGPVRPGAAPLAADFAGWIHIVTDRRSTLEALNTLQTHGVDALKIHYRLNDDSLDTILDFARQHALPIVGHVKSAREAAQKGIRFIEHMDPIVHDTVDDPERPLERSMRPERFDDLIALLVEKQVFVNPTLLYTVQAISRHRDEFLEQDREVHPALTGVPPFLKDRWIRRYSLDAAAAAEARADFEKVSEFLRRFAARGGLLLSGSNAGRAMLPGRSLHREMRLLVEAGLTPMQAIAATTVNAARFYRKENDLGTIAVGKKADLIVLDANPLDDIANTERIAHVVVEGRPVRRTLAFTNPFPRPVSDEPTPVIESVSPIRIVQGQPSARLTITGRDFFIGAEVLIDGTAVPATRVDDTRFEVPISAAIAARVGTYGVVVRSPLPAGGPSNERYFFVTFPVAGSK